MSESFYGVVLADDGVSVDFSKLHDPYVFIEGFHTLCKKDPINEVILRPVVMDRSKHVTYPARILVPLNPTLRKMDNLDSIFGQREPTVQTIVNGTYLRLWRVPFTYDDEVTRRINTHPCALDATNNNDSDLSTVLYVELSQYSSYGYQHHPDEVAINLLYDKFTNRFTEDLKEVVTGGSVRSYEIDLRILRDCMRAIEYEVNYHNHYEAPMRGLFPVRVEIRRHPKSEFFATVRLYRMQITSTIRPERVAPAYFTN